MDLHNIKIYHTGVPGFLVKDSYEAKDHYHGNILIPLRDGRTDYRYAQWINEDGEHYCNLSVEKFRAFCKLLPPHAHIYEYDKDFDYKRKQLLKTIQNCQNVLQVAKAVATFCIS